MIDPVSAFAMASAAYNTVKKGIEMGQELESMAQKIADKPEGEKDAG